MIYKIVWLICSIVCHVGAFVPVLHRPYQALSYPTTRARRYGHQHTHLNRVNSSKTSPLTHFKSHQSKSPVENAPKRRKKQKNKSSPSSSASASVTSNSIISILQQNNYGPNLITLTESDLPVLAELYAGGESKIGLIKRFRTPKSFKQTITPPLLEVEIVPSHTSSSSSPDNQGKVEVIDLGQITTVWPTNLQRNNGMKKECMNMEYLSDQQRRSMEALRRDFPVNHCEVVMQDLYKQKASVKKNGNMTKKDVKNIASMAATEEMSQHLEQVLRKLLKVGMGSRKRQDSNSGRLVNSFMAGNVVCDSCDDYRSILKGNGIGSLIERWMIGVEVLSTDAKISGRFKRSSCIFVSADYDKDISIIDTDVESESMTSSVQSLVIMNGGWFAVDESLRAGAEARNLVRRSEEDSATLAKESTSGADERIIYRLECLAMGESIQRSHEDQQSYEKSLTLDVRETLNAMHLPLSPRGAQEALIRMGRWSSDRESRKGGIEPWSPQVLASAKQLVEFEEQRRKQIALACSSDMSQEHNKSILEGRLDLSSLPSVCIDAKRTTFRDDAIGVRPRSITGRKVVKDASKWEVLIHIADVSDIYSVHKDKEGAHAFDPTPLYEASESRGVSRYDLPNGPLHLMPPVALRALGLVTKSLDKAYDTRGKAGEVNRCVTLWVYIDERNGKLLDSGVERSVISAPYALSYESASSILDSKTRYKKGSSLATAQAILTIAERNLLQWSSYRLNTNENAMKREQRLKVREMVASEVKRGSQMRDDGADGSFQRTRGHRVVDSALDLYGSTITRLLSKEKAPIPRTSGTARGGRVATAPLRRYIDGIAQRQLLSVLCDHGPAMTRDECNKVNRIATDAMNRVKNYSSVKSKSGQGKSSRPHVKMQQKKSLELLLRHLHSRGIKCTMPAMSTGRENEVVIKGAGAIAKCEGVDGSLKPGERVFVQVIQLDVDKQILRVKAVPSD